ncbi:MAG: OmpA family protein [Desulfobacterales bacterium]
MMKRKSAVTALFLSLLFVAVSSVSAFEIIEEKDIVEEVVVKENFIKQADNFIVLFDTSRSMAETYPASGGQKVEAAREILRQQNAILPDLGWNAGLYTFTPWKEYYAMAPYDKPTYTQAVDSLPTTRSAGGVVQQTTPLAEGIDKLNPILAKLSGRTAVFIFTDGTFQRVAPKRLWPMDAARTVVENHDVCLYFISSATSGKPQKLLEDMAALNACSRVIPFDDVYRNPVYGAGFLYVVDSTKEIVTATETRIAGVKMPNVHFEFGKYDVLPEYHQELGKLADFLKKNPKSDVVMAGFTDSVGTEEYNLPLSQRRVESVANFLKQMGVSADQMALLWYGKTNPIASNSTPEGRAKNRRVEIAVGGM